MWTEEIIWATIIVQEINVQQWEGSIDQKPIKFSLTREYNSRNNGDMENDMEK